MINFPPEVLATLTPAQREIAMRPDINRADYPPDHKFEPQFPDCAEPLTDYDPAEEAQPAKAPAPAAAAKEKKPYDPKAAEARKEFFKRKEAEAQFELDLSESDVKKRTEKAVSVLALIQEGQTLREVGVWFPTSQVKDGKLAGWLVKKKLQELRENGAGFAPISMCGKTFIPEN